MEASLIHSYYLISNDSHFHASSFPTIDFCHCCYTLFSQSLNYTNFKSLGAVWCPGALHHGIHYFPRSLSHCAVISLTPAPHNASICCPLSRAVNWLVFNHHACAPGQLPVICHVDTNLNSLHHHSHHMSRSPSTLLFFVFWITQNLQDHSGDYSHRMDNCFVAIGKILSALHLLECEGVEFELGIWMEMKRCKEDKVR
jgi:hypothetical protein